MEAILAMVYMTFIRAICFSAVILLSTTTWAQGRPAATPTPTDEEVMTSVSKYLLQIYEGHDYWDACRRLQDEIPKQAGLRAYKRLIETSSPLLEDKKFVLPVFIDNVIRCGGEKDPVIFAFLKEHMNTPGVGTYVKDIVTGQPFGTRPEDANISSGLLIDSRVPDVDRTSAMLGISDNPEAIRKHIDAVRQLAITPSRGRLSLARSSAIGALALVDDWEYLIDHYDATDEEGQENILHTLSEMLMAHLIDGSRPMFSDERIRDKAYKLFARAAREYKAPRKQLAAFRGLMAFLSTDPNFNLSTFDTSKKDKLNKRTLELLRDMSIHSSSEEVRFQAQRLLDRLSK
jgi:hypothetical protein